jgi:hypothetical protein
MNKNNKKKMYNLLKMILFREVDWERDKKKKNK